MAQERCNTEAFSITRSVIGKGDRFAVEGLLILLPPSRFAIHLPHSASHDEGGFRRPSVVCFEQFLTAKYDGIKFVQGGDLLIRLRYAQPPSPLGKAFGRPMVAPTTSIKSVGRGLAPAENEGFMIANMMG